jgi:hypothetical protein
MANEWQRYTDAAAAAGCPLDQVQRLIQFGIILTPKQLLAAAAARMADRADGPNKICVGGSRAGGKTHVVTSLMAADDAQRLPGYKGLFLRRVGKAAIESLLDLSKSVLRRVPHKLTTRGVIEFPNGSRIVAGHFSSERDIDGYLGLEYDGIAIEEGTTLSQRKLDSIATCCRTSKPNWRPRIYYSTNPGGVSHNYFRKTFIQPFRDQKETDTRFVPFTIDDNPHVDGGNRTFLDNLTGWLKRAWRP